MDERQQVIVIDNCKMVDTLINLHTRISTLETLYADVNSKLIVIDVLLNSQGVISETKEN